MCRQTEHKRFAALPTASSTGRHPKLIIPKRARRRGSKRRRGNSDEDGNTNLICPLFGHPSPPLINCKCTNRKQLLGSHIKRTQQNYTSFRPASLFSSPLHSSMPEWNGCAQPGGAGGTNMSGTAWNESFNHATNCFSPFLNASPQHNRRPVKYATQTPNPERSAQETHRFQNSKTLINSEQHCLTNTSPPHLSRTGWQETPTSWNWLVCVCVVRPF